MTREPVWQDDPPFAVGNKCTCGNTEVFQVHSWDCASRNPSEPQIAPATDADILRIVDEIDAGTQSGIRNVLSLIARIKAEREQTIRECAEIVLPLPLSCGTDIEKQAYDIRQVLFNRILSLIQNKEQSMTEIPTPTPTNETTMDQPTGQLQFVERTELTPDHTDVIVKRILQQQIATLSYRDGKVVAQSFRWQDVPCVEGN